MPQISKLDAPPPKCDHDNHHPDALYVIGPCHYPQGGSASASHPLGLGSDTHFAIFYMGKSTTHLECGSLSSGVHADHPPMYHSALCAPVPSRRPHSSQQPPHQYLQPSMQPPAGKASQPRAGAPKPGPAGGSRAERRKAAKEVHYRRRRLQGRGSPGCFWQFCKNDPRVQSGVASKDKQVGQ